MYFWTVTLELWPKDWMERAPVMRQGSYFLSRTGAGTGEDSISTIMGELNKNNARILVYLYLFIRSCSQFFVIIFRHLYTHFYSWTTTKIIKMFKIGWKPIKTKHESAFFWIHSFSLENISHSFSLETNCTLHYTWVL